MYARTLKDPEAFDTCSTCGARTDDGVYEAGAYYCGPCFDYAADQAMDAQIEAQDDDD